MPQSIGFMQGRLSPLVDDKIQAFPTDTWREEFGLARELGLSVMEWTLDHDGLSENPFVTEHGRAEILRLCREFSIRIPSVTGDCFMQAPFYKAVGGKRLALIDELDAVLRGMAELGGGQIVVPLVDNGHLDTPEQERVLRETLQARTELLKSGRLTITFEVDLPPQPAADFIAGFAQDCFGINYDIGNSAALGFDPEEEFAAYGERITNVHVKDRPLNGTTVPLGNGAAKFETVFALLARQGYRGNYILQTARATDGAHGEVLQRYAAMTRQWIENAKQEQE